MRFLTVVHWQALPRLPMSAFTSLFRRINVRRLRSGNRRSKYEDTSTAASKVLACPHHDSEPLNLIQRWWSSTTEIAESKLGKYPTALQFLNWMGSQERTSEQMPME